MQRCGWPRGRRGIQHDPTPFRWERVENGDFVPQNIPFTGDERLKVQMMGHTNPEDFFDLYVTDQLLDHIVTETNHYAQQYIAANWTTLKQYSRVTDWQDTTRNEMKTFLGILLLMGVVFKPRVSLYWSTDEIFLTPIFGQVMVRDRFVLLLKFFHFADNEEPGFNANDPDRDRLHKVRPVVELIRKRFSQVYSPGKNMSVDESLVLYKGRLAFKQYIQTKRVRFKIKLYELCTSSGISLDFMVYCGRGMIGDDEPNADMSATERIPANIMIPYLNQGHCLFVDNFYTSPKLAAHFLENGTHLCRKINLVVKTTHVN